MHVHTHNSLVEVWVRRLHDGVILVIHVAECIEALEYEFKKGLQVLGAG